MSYIDYPEIALNYKQVDLKLKGMEEISYVVVFPTVFSKNKIPQLITNIKKILKIKNLQFKSVKRDGDIVLVDANDPVFASSAINLLFGIEKIAIARKTENDFQTLVSEITSVGGNLILKGERFLVKVEGTSRGFLPKDIEIASTSSIIEKRSSLGAHPGTEEKYDKLLYVYLTKNNSYICIFSDKGNGGIPYKSQAKKTVCAIYDELSAVSCYETIKQGYDTRIIVCYRQKSELTDLIKILSQIIPRLVQKEIKIEFFNFKISSGGKKNYLFYINSILSLMLERTEERVSLALSPQIFSSDFVDNSLKQVFKNRKIPFLPLAGLDAGIFTDAKEIGTDRDVKRLEKIVGINSDEIPKTSKKIVDDSIRTKKVISVKVGPNNVHDILDSL